MESLANQIQECGQIDKNTCGQIDKNTAYIETLDTLKRDNPGNI